MRKISGNLFLSRETITHSHHIKEVTHHFSVGMEVIAHPLISKKNRKSQSIIFIVVGDINPHTHLKIQSKARSLGSIKVWQYHHSFHQFLFLFLFFDSTQMSLTSFLV